MVFTKGVQLLAVRMNSDATGTLAANTTVTLNSFTGFTRAFLCKKVIYAISAIAGAATDTVIIGCAQASASITEITSALSAMNIANPNDATNQIILDQWKVVYWDTVRVVADTGTGSHPVLNEHISLGGGKGIPFLEEDGVQVFAYNPGTAAFTTGGLVKGLVGFMGVYLND